jgi:hypothetical protein
MIERARDTHIWHAGAVKCTPNAQVLSWAQERDENLCEKTKSNKAITHQNVQPPSAAAGTDQSVLQDGVDDLLHADQPEHDRIELLFDASGGVVLDVVVAAKEHRK